MKLGRIAITSAIFASATPMAFAGGASFIDGVWIGKGTFQIGDKVVNCPDITMKFAGTDATYEVREAEMSCDELGKQTFTEIDKFTIDGDGVITFVQGTATSLRPGTKVGSVKGTTLVTLNPIGEGKIDDIRMRLDGAFLNYNQIAHEPGKTPDYSLVAIMTKQAGAPTAPQK
jgi:hypothetical protein